MKEKILQKQNICIIGAGLSGLAAGLLLIKKGYKVTLFEKTNNPGGRASSFTPSNLGLSEYLSILSNFQITIPFSEPKLETIYEKNMLKGYKLDTGFHLIGGGQRFVANGAFADIKNDLSFIGSRTGFVSKQGYRYSFFSSFEKIKLIPRILQLFVSYRESRLIDLYDVPIVESLEQFNNKKLKQALALFSRGIATHNDLSLISTGETIRALPKLLRGTQSLGYPRGGLKRLSDAYANFIINNRGNINYNSNVENIVIQKGNIRGIVTNGEEKKFDIVISSIPVQQIFSIVNESSFPSEYVKQLKRLIPSAGLCAYYCLKKINNPKLLGKTFMFLQENLDLKGKAGFGLIDFKTACPDSGLAPKNRYIVQAYIICTPDETQNKKLIKQLKNVLDSLMRILILDFDKQLLWAIYPVTKQLEGVAKIITNKRPSITTPINNFYLIGDCVKSSDFGINSCVNTAKKVEEIISKKER